MPDSVKDRHTTIRSVKFSHLLSLQPHFYLCMYSVHTLPLLHILLFDLSRLEYRCRFVLVYACTLRSWIAGCPCLLSFLYILFPFLRLSHGWHSCISFLALLSVNSDYPYSSMAHILKVLALVQRPCFWREVQHQVNPTKTKHKKHRTEYLRV